MARYRYPSPPYAGSKRRRSGTMYRYNRPGGRTGMLSNALTAAIGALSLYQSSGKKKSAVAARKVGNVRVKTRYHTTASRVSRFRKGRRKARYTNYDKYGSVKKIENGGLINDPDTVYVGHSTAAHEQLVPCVIRALVRHLFKQCGMDFVQWGAGVPIAAPKVWHHEIRYYSTFKNAAASSTMSNITGGTSTFLDVANDMYDDLKAVFTPQTEISDIRLLNQDGETQAQIHLKQFMCTFDIMSTLKLQNRTLATASITTAEHDEEINQVSNNPVVGKRYSGNFDGFLPDSRISYNSGNYDTLLCNTQSGLIAGEADDLPTGFKKPIEGQFLDGCYKSGKVIVMPGEIKTDTIRYRRRIAAADFFHKLNAEIDLSIAGDVRMRTRFGVAAMFGLEKQLNSRDSEVDISVAWELSQTYKCAGYYKVHAKTFPLLEIN